MRIDTYTKVLLTGIILFLGMMVFEVKPNMKAEAGIMSTNEILYAPRMAMRYVFHLRDGKLRICDAGRESGGWNIELPPQCSPWLEN